MYFLISNLYARNCLFAKYRIIKNSILFSVTELKNIKECFFNIVENKCRHEGFTFV